MWSIKKILGYIINAVLGFLSYPVSWVAITGIMGTINGPAYTIQEPELSSYRFFGMMLMLTLAVSLVISQVLIRVFLFRGAKKHYLFSLLIFFASMVLAVFLVK